MNLYPSGIEYLYISPIGLRISKDESCWQKTISSDIVYSPFPLPALFTLERKMPFEEKE